MSVCNIFLIFAKNTDMSKDISRIEIDRLKKILSIPTFFREEHQLLEHIITELLETPYDFSMDTYGNIYITKGEADWYPCVCAHTDSVQKYSEINIVETTEFSETVDTSRMSPTKIRRLDEHFEDKLILYGRDIETDEKRGMGADDKAGVFVCLELLDKMPVIKVALFASEEFGCIGSAMADSNFFKNVGYIMEFDCPENDAITHICNNVELFDVDGEFYSLIEPILLDKMPRKPILYSHPYTDVWELKKMLDVSCINIATGYYDYHRSTEYVIVDEVITAIEIGKSIIEKLGYQKYEFNNQKELYNENFRSKKIRFSNMSSPYEELLKLIPKNNVTYVEN